MHPVPLLSAHVADLCHLAALQLDHKHRPLKSAAINKRPKPWAGAVADAVMINEDCALSSVVVSLLN